MNTEKEYDLICVGAGIMSATLALITKLLDPNKKILILERLNDVAKESSAAWNNAGTGHSALCELNYTPEQENGTINIDKAVKICKQYEMSKQLWAYLVQEGFVENPQEFVMPVHHNSLVFGEDNTNFLEKRYRAFKEHFMFDTIEFTKDLQKLKEWFPLIMKHRSSNEIISASRINRGTEVNYGSLTQNFFSILKTKFNTPVFCNREVIDIDPEAEDWTVEIKDLETNTIKNVDAEHVFIGAGGGSLLLLQKVEIPEKEGYGGFPVSGEWLVCKNEEVIKQHHAKVYSKSGPNAPPMSTPHLDTRYINGKRQLMFGPFAGFSPKFLKEGSNLDLLKSIKVDNLHPMLGAFWYNLPLTKYLINQVLMNKEDRMEVLRTFVKDAKDEDWEVIKAGQRVQIIKKDEFKAGVLRFGTEVVSSKDGSITCLLGASPGASTATAIMMEVVEKAFPELLTTEKGKNILNKVIPFYNKEITPELFNKELKRVKKLLEL